MKKSKLRSNESRVYTFGTVNIFSDKKPSMPFRLGCKAYPLVLRFIGTRWPLYITIRYLDMFMSSLCMVFDQSLEVANNSPKIPPKFAKGIDKRLVLSLNTAFHYVFETEARSFFAGSNRTLAGLASMHTSNLIVQTKINSVISQFHLLDICVVDLLVQSLSFKGLRDCDQS